MQATTSSPSNRRAARPAVLLLALLGAAACSSTSASERASAASESMATFNVSTVQVRDGIDETLESLNALITSSGDEVKPRFASFQQSLTALEGQADVVRAEAAAMKERGDAYFEDWEADSSDISEERHSQLSLAYATIEQDMASARADFDPFLSSLRDVERYLKLDLTPQGLANAAPLAETATVQGDAVKQEIEAVLRHVNSVRGMISPAMEHE